MPAKHELAKLKICFVAGTLGQGGAERQLFYMVRLLHQRGTRVRVLSLTSGDFWEKRLTEWGVPVTWVGERSSRTVRLLRILSELRKDKPEILQSAHFYTNPYVLAASRILGLREIGAIRSEITATMQGENSTIRWMTLRRLRVIAANSRAAVDGAIRLGISPEHVRFLPNVVDADHFRPVPRDKTEPVRIAAVGRMTEEKRFDRLLSVLSAAKSRTQVPIKLMIAGSGPLHPKLARQAGELNLDGMVEFLGIVPDTSAVYRNADMLVLTSDHEGTPNVLLEAMASGLPVVATRVGGVPELVCHNSTGYLIDPGDDGAFTDAVLELVEHPRLRAEMGTRARAQAEAHHITRVLPEVLEDLYNLALS